MAEKRRCGVQVETHQQPSDDRNSCGLRDAGRAVRDHLFAEVQSGSDKHFGRVAALTSKGGVATCGSARVSEQYPRQDSNL
jgi:hypothetical protein